MPIAEGGYGKAATPVSSLQRSWQESRHSKRNNGIILLVVSP